MGSPRLQLEKVSILRYSTMRVSNRSTPRLFSSGKVGLTPRVIVEEKFTQVNLKTAQLRRRIVLDGKGLNIYIEYA